MIAVRLPVALRRHAVGAARIELECATVDECLRELEQLYPGVRPDLRDQSMELQPSVNLYVNGEDIRYLSGPATSLKDGDELTIVIAIAGGGP